MESKPTVKDLVSRSPEEIVSFLGGIYYAPWVAGGLVEGCKYWTCETLSELADQMRGLVDSAPKEKQLEMLRSYPELSEKISKMSELSEDSRVEQERSGLQFLTEDELCTFNKHHDMYRAKFDFPFILAVRNATKHTILSALVGRSSDENRSKEQEFAVAMQQVHKIAWMRLLSKIDTSDASGFLTCRVLDTVNRCPARAMRVQLHRLSSDGGPCRQLVAEYLSSDDGRIASSPLLKGGTNLKVGSYEWTFYVEDYFASLGTKTCGQPFLGVVPIRFGIDNPDEHYHVPLLISPWGYSIYRGGAATEPREK